MSASPDFPVTAAGLAEALGGRRIGTGKWQACCPAHDDKHPSLAIREAEDGTVLVHCRSGCDQRQVIEALRGRGLWKTTTSSWAASHPGLTWAQVEHARMVVQIARFDIINHRDHLWTDLDRHDYQEARTILARARTPQMSSSSSPSIPEESLEEGYAPC